MGNIIEKLGFKKEIASYFSDIFNSDVRGVNYHLVPFGQTMLYACNNVLYECRIVSVVYNLKYDGKSYSSAIVIERAKGDGTTCHAIIGNARGTIFETEEDYINFKSAERSNVADVYVPDFALCNNFIPIANLARGLVTMDYTIEGCHRNVGILWKWNAEVSNAVSFHPNLDLIWADECGIHYEDKNGYFSNTDVYFTTKESCVNAHRPQIVKFGEKTMPTELREYVVEVAVNVKAKSYEEAISICNGAKINIVEQ